jgi:hypothetical protein
MLRHGFHNLPIDVQSTRGQIGLGYSARRFANFTNHHTQMLFENKFVELAIVLLEPWQWQHSASITAAAALVSFIGSSGRFNLVVLH